MEIHANASLFISSVRWCWKNNRLIKITVSSVNLEINHCGFNVFIKAEFLKNFCVLLRHCIWISSTCENIFLLPEIKFIDPF